MLYIDMRKRHVNASRALTRRPAAGRVRDSKDPTTLGRRTAPRYPRRFRVTLRFTLSDLRLDLATLRRGPPRPVR